MALTSLFTSTIPIMSAMNLLNNMAIEDPLVQSGFYNSKFSENLKVFPGYPESGFFVERYGKAGAQKVADLNVYARNGFSVQGQKRAGSQLAFYQSGDEADPTKGLVANKNIADKFLYNGDMSAGIEYVRNILSQSSNAVYRRYLYNFMTQLMDSNYVKTGSTGGYEGTETTFANDIGTSNVITMETDFSALTTAESHADAAISFLSKDLSRIQKLISKQNNIEIPRILINPEFLDLLEICFSYLSKDSRWKDDVTTRGFTMYTGMPYMTAGRHMITGLNSLYLRGGTAPDEYTRFAALPPSAILCGTIMNPLPVRVTFNGRGVESVGGVDPTEQILYSMQGLMNMAGSPGVELVDIGMDENVLKLIRSGANIGQQLLGSISTMVNEMAMSTDVNALHYAIESRMAFGIVRRDPKAIVEFRVPDKFLPTSALPSVTMTASSRQMKVAA